MEYFFVYLAFALATAFSASYELFWPLVKKAQAAGVENEITQSPVLSTTVFFIIQTIFAPLVILIIFIPPFYLAMSNGLEKEIMRGN